jgi:EAL domain-containing protein (putative c-di-GMP-specific phosphodiesterase class I)
MLDLAPADTFLALNMSPATITTIHDRQLCQAEFCPRIVIELTEHVPIQDYSSLHRVLAPMRAHGARLAADDLGSGYAGFRHLIALEPDIIKLDISLIRGIQHSRGQRALTRALLAFAADVDATVIAEGVEDADELAVLIDLGVPWAQGYHLGRPAPAARWTGTRPL